MSGPSEWRITSNFIGDQKMYCAYRLREVSEPDHSGNREYFGGYTPHRQEAADRVNELNEQEVW